MVRPGDRRFHAAQVMQENVPRQGTDEKVRSLYVSAGSVQRSEC
jgi:hypothetical protein